MRAKTVGACLKAGICHEVRIYTPCRGAEQGGNTKGFTGE